MLLCVCHLLCVYIKILVFTKPSKYDQPVDAHEYKAILLINFIKHQLHKVHGYTCLLHILYIFTHFTVRMIQLLCFVYDFHWKEGRLFISCRQLTFYSITIDNVKMLNTLVDMKSLYPVHRVKIKKVPKMQSVHSLIVRTVIRSFRKMSKYTCKQQLLFD